ncbi:MAG: serine/threonine protein phosphatase, partial [Alphaproteobacteria bacterium]|nr:serine/threonine protein phosphatase [Alphaproteobacteria bacterium]
MMLRFGKAQTTSASKEVPVRRGPPGRRCYAIGDVHGRFDLLDDLLEQIERDVRDRPSGDHVIVFLGDLIDRGPDSRGVVRLVRQGIGAAKVLCLKGNHEEMLARGLMGEASVLPNWLAYGGYECAQSYGVEIGALFGRSADEVETVLAQAIPAADVSFLAALPDSARFGDYFLVHAGIRPKVPLDQQDP